MNNINNENIPFDQEINTPSHAKYPKKAGQEAKLGEISSNLQRPFPASPAKKLEKAKKANTKDEMQLLRNFVQFLSGHLDQNTYKKQIEQLWNIGIDKKIFESVDLLKVKSSLITIRDQIIHILKNIKIQDLEILNNLSTELELPTDFENIFELAILLQSKESKIRTVHKLLDYGEVDMALFMTSKLASEDKRKEALTEIAEDFEKRIDLNKIPEIIRFDLLTKIFKHVIKEKDPDHILELGTTILNAYSSFTLKRSKHFYSALSKLDADTFVKLANTLGPEKQESFLEKFFMYLQERDETDQATEIAKKTNSQTILKAVLESN